MCTELHSNLLWFAFAGCTAEFESFRYYSEGVYYEPDCATASADLDHAVLLFGYGTTPDGALLLCRALLAVGT